MSYVEEQLILLKDELIKIKNAQDYEFVLFKTISKFYLFLKDINIKEEIIDSISEYCLIDIVDMNLIKFILDKNILLLSDNIIYNRWILIDKLVKRVEFSLVKVNHGYEVYNKKEYEVVNYKEIIKN